MPEVLEAGQVWEHRHPCRLCGTPARPHRHGYLIIRAPAAAGDLVIARDTDPDGRAIGSAYAMRAEAFGSLDKGGLRLAGTIVRGRLERVPNPDERVIDHPRIPPRGVGAKIVPAAARG